MKTSTRLLAIVAILNGLIAMTAGGCAMLHKPSVPSISKPVSSHSTAGTFSKVDDSMTFLIVASVVCAGVAIGAYFALPEGHKLWSTAAGSALGVLGVSVVMKVTLPIVPIVVYSLAAVAGVLLLYKFYAKYKSGGVTAVVQSLESGATEVESGVIAAATSVSK